MTLSFKIFKKANFEIVFLKEKKNFFEIKFKLAFTKIKLKKFHLQVELESV